MNLLSPSANNRSPISPLRSRTETRVVLPPMIRAITDSISSRELTDVVTLTPVVAVDQSGGSLAK